MYSGRIVVDFAGVAIGVVTDDGQAYNHSDVHMGSVTEDGTVVDFAGVRIGKVAGTRTREPVGAAG